MREVKEWFWESFAKEYQVTTHPQPRSQGVSKQAQPALRKLEIMNMPWNLWAPSQNLKFFLLGHRKWLHFVIRHLFEECRFWIHCTGEAPETLAEDLCVPADLFWCEGPTLSLSSWFQSISLLRSLPFWWHFLLRKYIRSCTSPLKFTGELHPWSPAGGCAMRTQTPAPWGLNLLASRQGLCPCTPWDGSLSSPEGSY
jgi:hypothetical protein